GWIGGECRRPDARALATADDLAASLGDEVVERTSLRVHQDGTETSVPGDEHAGGDARPRRRGSGRRCRGRVRGRTGCWRGGGGRSAISTGGCGRAGASARGQ